MRLDGQNTHLEMGVPWEDKVLFVVCAFDEDAYERLEVVLHGGYLVEEPEADVGRDLVVARAARVQLAAERANELAEAALVRGVDVLVVFLRRELRCGSAGAQVRKRGRGTHNAIGPLLAHGGEAGNHALLLGGGEDADTGEGLGVRDGAADVDGGHALVVLERLVECVHPAGVSAVHGRAHDERGSQGIGLSGEAAAPELLLRRCFCHGE